LTIASEAPATSLSPMVEAYRNGRCTSPENIRCMNAFDEPVCTMLDLLMYVKAFTELLIALDEGNEDSDRKVIEAYLEELGLIDPNLLASTVSEIKGFLPIFQKATAGATDFGDSLVQGFIIAMIRQRAGIYSLELGDAPSDASLLDEIMSRLDDTDEESERTRGILSESICDQDKLIKILSGSQST